ncbi:MAG: 5-oxoprolinase subunit PxpB, partial [Thermotaleaceae bacterium]
EIPTCYHEDFGPDIHFVAQQNQLSIDEVISIHSNNEYLIYMLGFTPGYCYLGGMSEKIAAPRLSKPRTAVAAGSVGIAGTQTGIYPIESPGGWQLIGRTPLDLYNPAREENPILLEAGNYIRFLPITKEEYRDIQQNINQNCYQVKKYLKRI